MGTTVFLSHCLSMSELRPSSIGAIEGKLNHAAALAQDGLAECDQLGKISWNTPPRPGIEPGPRRGQTVRNIHCPTKLSWPGPQRGQTERYIHSPTERPWPGPWRGQTVRYIHSPTELSWPGPWRGQTVRYIHSPTELSWPGPQRGQTERYIHSPTELSLAGPWRGQDELTWLTGNGYRYHIPVLSQCNSNVLYRLRVVSGLIEADCVKSHQDYTEVQDSLIYLLSNCKRYVSPHSYNSLPTVVTINGRPV